MTQKGKAVERQVDSPEPVPTNTEGPVEEAEAVIEEGDWEEVALEQEAEKVREEMAPPLFLLKGLEGPTREWEKRVMYAYFRLLKVPHEVASHAVGRKRQTTRLWTQEESYLLAQEHARRLYMPEVEGLAMATLTHSLRKGLSVGRGKADDGRLALDVLGRIRPEFEPVAVRPPTKKEADGTEGSMEPVGAARDRILGRLAGISGRLLTGGTVGPASDNGGRPAGP